MDRVKVAMDRSAGQRVGRRVALGAAAAGGLAAALMERRHLHAIAHDPEYLRLTASLGGRPLHITSADGTSLYAEAFGREDGPAVVLAHGWTEQLHFWGPVIRRLRDDGLYVVAYDLRGHGHSDPAVDGDYSMKRFGEDVEAVLAHANEVGGRATVVGHSLGAMSIAAWAEHHDPQRRARAAALVNTGLGDLLARHLLFGEAAKFLNHPWASRAFMGARLRIPPFSTPLQQALIRYVAFGPTAGRGQVAFFERMLVECPSDVRAACGVALSDMDLWHDVARLTVPTLVVAGEDDRLTPPIHARRIAHDLPVPAGLIELPATGHMSPLERPRELTDALERLVAETAPVSEPAGEPG